MLIGYARHCPSNPFPSSQVTSLLHAGADTVYEETAEDGDELPPILDLCISSMQPSQVVLVLDLRVISSVARTIADTIKALDQRGARLSVLRCGAPFDSVAQSNLVFHMTATMTEYWDNRLQEALKSIPPGTNDVDSYLDLIGVPLPQPRSRSLT